MTNHLHDDCSTQAPTSASRPRRAFWVHRQTGREVYTVALVPARRGRSGWAEYRAALAQCAQIGRTLGPDYEMRYREGES